MKKIKNVKSKKLAIIRNVLEPLVDIATAQGYLGVPKKTIYRWCYMHIETEFPFYKVGRHLKFRISEIDEWLRKFKWSESGKVTRS